MARREVAGSSAGAGSALVVRNLEYVKDVRDADRGNMNYDQAQLIMDGKTPVQTLTIDAGTLVLFRGRNSMHRVTPTQGSITYAGCTRP